MSGYRSLYLKVIGLLTSVLLHPSLAAIMLTPICQTRQIAKTQDSQHLCISFVEVGTWSNTHGIPPEVYNQ